MMIQLDPATTTLELPTTNIVTPIESVNSARPDRQQQTDNALVIGAVVPETNVCTTMSIAEYSNGAVQSTKINVLRSDNTKTLLEAHTTKRNIADAGRCCLTMLKPIGSNSMRRTNFIKNIAKETNDNCKMANGKTCVKFAKINLVITQNNYCIQPGGAFAA